MSIQTLKKDIREILSEPNGPLSWGRVASSIALFAAIIWVSHDLYLNGRLPPMEGITGFTIAPYTANKFSTAVQSFNNGVQGINPANQK